MRKLARRALAAIAATATAALTAAPAAADPLTYTVQNGDYLTGTNSGDIIGFGIQSGATFECPSSVFSGSTPKDAWGNPVVNGTVDGDGIVTLDDVWFAGPGEDVCLVNGAHAQVTPLGLPWKFVATGAGTGSGPAETTEGRLADVQIKVGIPSLGCQVIVGGPGAGGSDGYAEATYTNPSTLTANDGTLYMPFLGATNLTVLSVSSPIACAGVYDLGETVLLTGYYNLFNAIGISPTID